jgi:hypothetical protein
MPGLSLGVGAQVRSGGTPTFSSTAPNGTAYQQGFGLGSDSASNGETGLASLFPNDPFGVAFWGGVVSLVLLIGLYHTLPN